jgi:hypothetical protein
MERKNGMATAGMICGIISIVLCWVPFAGLVLGILGIVFGSIGMSRANRIGVGRGAGITGLVTGILGFVLLPMMAAIAIPAFLDYMEKGKTTRSKLELHSIEVGIKSYYMMDGRLPPTAAQLPGDPAYCGMPIRMSRDWRADPGWAAIGFEADPSTKVAYRWTKDSEKSGHIEALADLDCDGTVSMTRVDVDVIAGDVHVRYSEPTRD